MRSSRLAALGGALILAFVAAACGSSASPGWTYQPAASVTPAPSGAASAEPSGGAAESAEPSGSAAASSEPSGGGGGETVTVVATNPTSWDTPELEAPADTPFTLEFDNQDATAPHNVVIKNPDGSNVDMGDTSFFQGPEKRTYDVPALAAGDYQFICEVHPTTMVGTLTAG